MKLNLKLLKQAAAIARPYWVSAEGRKSYWLVALLILAPSLALWLPRVLE